MRVDKSDGGTDGGWDGSDGGTDGGWDECDDDGLCHHNTNYRECKDCGPDKSLCDCCPHECDCGPDVRGMCFSCIGDMTKMTEDDIKRVRYCAHTPYAIAFWFFNNIFCELYWEHEQTSEVLFELYNEFIKRDDMQNLRKILPEDDFSFEEIRDHFEDMVSD